MGKRYYLDERPEKRSKEEQAKINKQNEEEQWQHLTEMVEKACKGAKEYFYQKQQMRLAIDSGEVAIVCEESSILEFNGDYTVAKYGNKEVTFKKGGLENEMLGILARATASESNFVQEEQLIGSLGRATGKDDVIYKTVRNTRDRINKKLYEGLGLAEVVKMTDNKYRLNKRYLRLPKKYKISNETKNKARLFSKLQGLSKVLKKSVAL